MLEISRVSGAHQLSEGGGSDGCWAKHGDAGGMSGRRGEGVDSSQSLPKAATYVVDGSWKACAFFFCMYVAHPNTLKYILWERLCC